EVAELRGRKGDLFLLSPFAVGSTWTGYRRTSTHYPLLDLATATAISGAAAAPNMGVATVGPVRFLLALLNVRLGYWLTNPRDALSADSPWHRRAARWIADRIAPLACLLAEMRGALRPDTLYVNLSDGGHVENLGAFELIRRNCRVVIAVDAEADPEYGFEGLAALIRYARTDLNV
ncbi:MAG: hypothetical protein KDK70_44720, partial [Myxococcales bacterium]|nr:hypothetical protein [Myxococcales bacterium]